MLNPRSNNSSHGPLCAVAPTSSMLSKSITTSARMLVRIASAKLRPPRNDLPGEAAGPDDGVLHYVASDMVFAQQVYEYGVRADIVIWLSTSGTSRNIVHALQVGRCLGLRTIGSTGESGGVLRSICDVTVRVQSSDTMHIQERPFPMHHPLCLMLADEFFPS